jgi:hypothetical protein
MYNGHERWNDYWIAYGQYYDEEKYNPDPPYCKEGPEIAPETAIQDHMMDITNEVRSGGALYGEAKGILMTRDGQEMVTYTAEGIGRVVGPGKIRFLGSVFYSTASTGKLAFLNNLVAVFEHEVDESGNVSNKLWEWK